MGKFKFTYVLLLLATCSCMVQCHTEVVPLKTWDFEEAEGPGDGTHWDAYKCAMTQITSPTYNDQGGHSLLVYNREKSGSSVMMKYHEAEPNTYYYVNGHVAVTHVLHDFRGHNVQFKVQELDAEGTTIDTFNVATLQFVTNESLVNISGDFKTGPNTVGLVVRFSVRDVEINFVVDDVTLYKIIPEEDWEAAADARIEQYRKGDLNVSITHYTKDACTGTLKLNIEDYDLVLRQKTHSDFGFGAAMDDTCLVCDQHCRDLVFDFFGFNFVTLANDLKWPALEDADCNFNPNKSLDVIDVVNEKGGWVRAHNLFWQRLDRMSECAANTPSVDEMVELMWKHVVETVQAFKGHVNTWDVSNEFENTRLLEQLTGDWDMLVDVFNSVADIDPDVYACTNEYNVLTTNGLFLQANLNTLDKLRKGYSGKLCAGMQSHFEHRQDSILLGRRLDYFIEHMPEGTDVWISELTADLNDDEDEQIDFYLEMYKQAFSRQHVRGLIFWAFSDQMVDFANCSLTKGDNYHVTPAGHAIRDLIQSWTTNEVHNLDTSPLFEYLRTEKRTVGSFRGFYGDYDVHIVNKLNGLVVASKTASIVKGETTSVSFEI